MKHGTCHEHRIHHVLDMHFNKLDVETNETTLTLYVVYMSQFIKLTSVKSYLMGISHYLVVFYPNILHWRSTPLLLQTLHGCKKLYGSPIWRK
jgi:hypothetical protein